MAKHIDYILDTDVECDRLERQDLLQGPDCVLKHIAAGPGMRILDAGSGSGAIARLLAARFPETEIVGVDINPRFVEYAQKLAAAEGLTNLTFQVGDLENLPFEQPSFDIVWCQYVLYFVPDPALVLSEFRRVTRPSGQVIAKIHDPMTGNFPEDERLQPLMEKLIDVATSGLRGKRLPSLFKNAGLADIDIEIETDPIYTVLGAIDAAHRRNFEEVVVGLTRRLAHLFGGTDEANAFVADWLAYLDRDDTNTITTSWVAKGRVPSDA
jgi:SAM-dependent methyltransferase